jgi:hypothetical protein
MCSTMQQKLSAAQAIRWRPAAAVRGAVAAASRTPCAQVKKMMIRIGPAIKKIQKKWLERHYAKMADKVEFMLKYTLLSPAHRRKAARTISYPAHRALPPAAAYVLMMLRPLGSHSGAALLSLAPAILLGLGLVGSSASRSGWACTGGVGAERLRR